MENEEPPVHHLTPHGKEMSLLYEKVVVGSSFYPLIHYPCLLFKWQHSHPQDKIKIAAIASHKLKHHYFCKTDEICNGIEVLIQKYAQSQL